MVYAQFYQRAVWPVGTAELIEATGDRSVIIIDGRLKRRTMERIALAECAKRGYLAWQLFRGDSFTRSVPVTGLSML